MNKNRYFINTLNKIRFNKMHAPVHGSEITDRDHRQRSQQRSQTEITDRKTEKQIKVKKC